MCCEQHMNIACGILVHAIRLPYTVNHDLSSKMAALTPMGWNVRGDWDQGKEYCHAHVWLTMEKPCIIG